MPNGTWTTTGGDSGGKVIGAVAGGIVILAAAEFALRNIAVIGAVAGIVAVAALAWRVRTCIRQDQAAITAAFARERAAALTERAELRAAQAQALPPAVHFHNDLHIHQYASGTAREPVPVMRVIPGITEELPR